MPPTIEGQAIAPATDIQAVTSDRLRSFVERIETLEAEKREVAEQIREVYAEAKGEGFDTKVMRMIVRLRGMKPHDRAELDDLLSVYRSAVGV